MHLIQALLLLLVLIVGLWVLNLVAGSFHSGGCWPVRPLLGLVVLGWVVFLTWMSFNGDQTP